ncbi:MAG: penicillin-binding protein 2 [Candidatus Pacebacteria bacterium]|nr:penicillin-binding protein 2 [Candidatus Paceibacterota bacterium]
MLKFPRRRGYQKFKVKGSGEIETDEVFLDAIVQKKQSAKDIGYGRIETALSRKTFVILFGLFVFVTAGFLLRAFYFQVIDFSVYAEKAERNRYISSNIDSQRGIIYDRNFNQLVSNNQTFNLICEYSSLPAESDILDREIMELSKIMAVSAEEIKNRIEEKRGKNPTAVIFDNLDKDADRDKIIVLETKMEILPGFKIEKNSTRIYNDAEYFSLLLGFVSRDSKSGQLGIEQQYDEYLKETPGILERDRGSDNEEEKIVKPAKPGNNILLNIDAGLQKKIGELLKEDVLAYGAKSGAVVAIDPKTGGVLALNSYPSFDSNIFSKAVTEEEYNDLMSNSGISFYNRTIAGEYPIGSTIKPLIASAALEENVITASKTIDCAGGLQLKDGTFKKDWTTHGPTDLTKAISESCDTYFYIVGGGYQGFTGLGVDRIDKYLAEFGLGKTTGIDLAGEKAGFVPSADWKQEETGVSWYPGDTYNMSIGQGYLKVTPLQLAMATVAIANGGKLLEPQIVNSVLDENNNVIKKFEPAVINSNFIASQYLEEVRQGMRQTVLSPAGTARGLQSMPVTSAAKTGTAQTGKADVYHNLITLFAPYEDPQIVITIVIESVPNQTGVANLLSRQIMQYYFGDRLQEEAAKQAAENGQDNGAVIENQGDTIDNGSENPAIINGEQTQGDNGILPDGEPISD